MAQTLDINSSTTREYIKIILEVTSERDLYLWATTHPEGNYNHTTSFGLYFIDREHSASLRSTYDGFSGSTNSVGSIDILRNRLEACVASSPKEQQVIGKGNFVPTRLVEVRQLKANTREKAVRVVSTKDLLIKPPYLTLSHRWGGNPQLRLLTTNNKSMHERIAWNTIPRTYADALQLTLSLGYHYVWIDALCIIQDDMEDWNEQAAEMGDIYRNTDMNIYASASTDESSGIFKHRDPISLGILVRASNWPGMLESYLDVQPDLRVIYRYHRGDRNTHLGSRGWVLQEEFLAPAVAYFDNHGIYWACHHGSAPEFPQTNRHVCALDEEYWDMRELDPSNGTEPPGTLQAFELPIAIKRLFNFGLSNFSENPTPSRRWTILLWREVIRAYTNCDLTYDLDKLSAISGIAREIGKVLGWSANEYAAGMWKPILLSQLLWGRYLVDGKKPSFVERPREYIAPSWSWASLKGPVTLDPTCLGDEEKEPRRIEYISSLQDLHVSRSANPFGPVTGGFIVLKSQTWKLTLLQVIPSSHPWGITYGVFAMVCGHQVKIPLFLDGETMDTGTVVFLTLRAIIAWKRRTQHDKFKAGLDVDGLMLLPTGNRGEYVRIGWASVVFRKFVHECRVGHNLDEENYLEVHHDEVSHLSESARRLIRKQDKSKEERNKIWLDGDLDEASKQMKDPNYTIRIV